MQANSLEEAMAQPKEVRSLVLTRQSLGRFPAKVWKKLSELEHLDLSHNNIKKLPQGLGQLTKLRSLQLSYNNINRVEENLLGLLPNLRHLDLRHNRLRQFALASTSLESLDVSENRLKGVAPLSLFCPQLLHLNASNNRLEDFVMEQEDLPALQYLNLSHNRLKVFLTLPSAIYALILNNNRISRLNMSALGLTQLQRLELAHNPIDIKLTDLETCPKLSYLDVRYTPSRWPGASALLLKLPNLRHLYGGLSKKVQEQLSGFLTEVPQTIKPGRRTVFFRLWQGFAAGNVPGEVLWSCFCSGLHPIIQIGAYYELLRKYPAKYGQLRSRTWWMCGEMALGEDLLKERLTAAGVSWTDDPDKANGVLLGHKFPENANIPSPGLPVMEERSLVHWLDRREQRYLTHTRQSTQIANLERMLTARAESTFFLGTEILRTQGTPDASIVILLKKWLTSTQEERKAWEDVLLPYLPGDLKIALQQRDRMLTLPPRRGQAGEWWKCML